MNQIIIFNILFYLQIYNKFNLNYLIEQRTQIPVNQCLIEPHDLNLRTTVICLLLFTNKIFEQDLYENYADTKLRLNNFNLINMFTLKN